MLKDSQYLPIMLSAFTKYSMASMVLFTVCLTCLGGLISGWLFESWLVGSTAALVTLCVLTLSKWPQAAIQRYWATGHRPAAEKRVVTQSRPKPSPLKTTERDTSSIVEEMLRQGRYAILLRPRIRDELSPGQRDEALAALNEGMSLTPAGKVMLRTRSANLADVSQQGHVVQMDDYYLDRFPVTNQQYAQFVLAGGYDEPSFWAPEILCALADFVDQTGTPGPRFWTGGEPPAGRQEHPVVGICWYEADAYARWSGKRLPSDPEWVKAATWPLITEDNKLIQRKYPWGDSMAPQFANLWETGRRDTACISEFAAGESRGGVFHLIGNVWEWMHGPFGDLHDPRDHLTADQPLKSIRGGAFDTYFENQATCQFQSGDSSVARKHNIGFRCSIAAADLGLPKTEAASQARDLAARPLELAVDASGAPIPLSCSEQVTT